MISNSFQNSQHVSHVSVRPVSMIEGNLECSQKKDVKNLTSLKNRDDPPIERLALFFGEDIW